MARILVVDDEPGIRLTLQGLLRRSGHEVEAAESGEAALQCVDEAGYDLLLVDLLMGGLDGIDLIERVRSQGSDTAIVVLTGHPSVNSATRALRNQVDDYLVKPAGADEIRQTVRRVLERRHLRQERDVFLRQLAVDVQQLLTRGSPGPCHDPRRPSETLRVGSLTLELDSHRVTWRGRVLDLTPTEFHLLAVLAKHAGTVLTPQRLVEATRDYRCTMLEARELIKPHILHLRAKLETDPRQPRHLLTVRGVGYCLRLDAAGADCD